jgi:hypothetical protein
MILPASISTRVRRCFRTERRSHTRAPSSVPPGIGSQQAGSVPALLLSTAL